MRADQPFDPNVTGCPIYFYLGDLSGDGLAAKRIGDSPPGENIPAARPLRSGTRVPAINFRRRFNHGNGARASESAVVCLAGCEQPQTELDWICFRGSGQFIDK